MATTRKTKPVDPRKKYVKEEMYTGVTIHGQSIYSILVKMRQYYDKFCRNPSRELRMFDNSRLTDQELMERTKIKYSSVYFSHEYSPQFLEEKVREYEVKLKEYNDWYEANKKVLEEKKAQQAKVRREKKRIKLLEQKEKIEKELQKYE